MSPIGWREQRHADSIRPVLISGALVLDPLGELHRPSQLDILINHGEIVALGREALSHGRFLGAELIDATGYLVTPGFINAHCHSHDTLLRGLCEQPPLEVWGHTAFPFHWTPRTADEVCVRTRLHAVECLRGGMTTIQDMVTLVDSSLDHAHALAASYAESGIEALVAQQFSDLSEAAQKMREAAPVQPAGHSTSKETLLALRLGCSDNPPKGTVGRSSPLHIGA